MLQARPSSFRPKIALLYDDLFEVCPVCSIWVDSLKMQVRKMGEVRSIRRASGLNSSSSTQTELGSGSDLMT